MSRLFANSLTAEYISGGVNLIGKSVDIAIDSYAMAREQVASSLSEKSVDENVQRCMDIMFSSSWPKDEKRTSLGT